VNKLSGWINKLLARTGSQYRLISFQHLDERTRDAQELGRVVAQQAYERRIDELNKQHLELQERVVELKRRLACAISSAHYYRKKSSKKPVELEA
jgi:hypothetical protein